MAYLNQKLKTAIERQDEGAIEQLLECGADPNAFLSGEDIAPIHLGPGISKSVTYLLLKYGGDPNLGTSDGITPLHIAATWGNKNIVKLLLRNGANIYIRDDEGLTPLDMAKKYEHEKCEIILKRHAHLLESQSNIQERRVKRNPKIEPRSKRITCTDTNFDASQDLFVDSDPEYHLAPVKQEKPRSSVLYRKKIQNQINHLCKNKKDFHLDVTSPNHPCVTPKMQFHIPSPKHIRAYTEPMAESTSTPIRPRRSIYTASVQQKIDEYTGNGENVGIDVTSPDHPELFFTPSAKSPLNNHQKIPCETPIKSLPNVMPFKLDDSSDVGSSSSESDLYVTVNEAPVEQMTISPQNALDLDKLKHSTTHKIEQLRNCLNKLDTQGLKPFMTNQPVTKNFYPVQDKLYSRSEEPSSRHLPSENRLYSKRMHPKALGPNHDVDVKFSMELPPKMVRDNGKSSRKLKHSRHQAIKMNVGESYDNEKSDSRKSKREPVIDIQIQPECESRNIKYKVRNKESDLQVHEKSKLQHKSRGSHKQRVVLKSPEIQRQHGSRVRSKSAHENACLPAHQDKKEYHRSTGNSINGRCRQETYSYPGERIYSDRLTHEITRKNEKPDHQLTHENQRGRERPEHNGRIHQLTYENQREREKPEHNGRIHQLTHENQRERERPEHNGRIHQLTYENQREREKPEHNGRIHQLTHENQRERERPEHNGRIHQLTYENQREREKPEHNGRIHQLTHENQREREKPEHNGRIHQLTYENQREREKPEHNGRIHQLTHENHRGRERPEHNGRIHQLTHENHRGREKPEHNGRIHQLTYENQRERERPEHNGRIQLTHENQKESERPEHNERIYQLTHENQRESERTDHNERIHPNRLVHCNSRNQNKIADEYSRNAYIIKPTQTIPPNSSQHITSKNYKSKMSTHNGQSSHDSDISENVTAQSHIQLLERANNFLEREIIPEKYDPISRRKVQIFPSRYEMNDQKTSLLRKQKDLNCNSGHENQIFRERGCMVMNDKPKYGVLQKVAHASHYEKATKLPESVKQESVLHSQSHFSNVDPCKKHHSKRNRSSVSSVNSTDTYYTCKSELDTEDFYSCEDGLEPHGRDLENPLTILMNARKKLFHPFEEVAETLSSKESSYLREFEFNRDELVQALSEFNLRDPSTSTSTDTYSTALSNLENLIIAAEEPNDNDFTRVEASCGKSLVDSSQLKYLQSEKPNTEVEESLFPLRYIPAQMNNSHYITAIAEANSESSARGTLTAPDRIYEEFETAIEQVLLSRSPSKCRSPAPNQISKSNPSQQYSSCQDSSDADNFFLVCVPSADDKFVSTASQQSVNISSSVLSDEVDQLKEGISHPTSDEPTSLNPIKPDLFHSCIENKNASGKIPGDIKDTRSLHSINFSHVLSELKMKTELKAIQSQEKTCYRWQPPENVMNSSQTTDESFLNGKGRDSMMKQLKKKVGLELKDHPLVKSQKLAIEKSSDSPCFSTQEDGLHTSQVLPDKTKQAAQVYYLTGMERFNETQLKNISTRKYLDRTRLPQSKIPSNLRQNSVSVSNQISKKFSKGDQDETHYISLQNDSLTCKETVRGEISEKNQSISRIMVNDNHDFDQSYYQSLCKDESTDHSFYISLKKEAKDSRQPVSCDYSLNAEQSFYTSVCRNGSLDAERSCYISVRQDRSPNVERSCYTSVRRNGSDSSVDVERSCYTSVRRDSSLDAEPSCYTSVRRDSSPDAEPSCYTSVRRDSSLDAEPSCYTSVRRDSSPDAEPSCYTSVRRDSSPDAEPSCYTSVRRDSSPDAERSCYTSVRRDSSPDAERSCYTSVRRDSSLDVEPSCYTSARRDSSVERSCYSSMRRNGSDSSLDAEPSCYTSVRRDSSPDAEPSCYTSVRRDSSPDAEPSCYTSVRRDSSPDAELSCYTSVRRDSSPDAEPSCYTSVRRDSSPDAEPSCYTSVRRDSSPDAEPSCYTSARRDSSVERSCYSSMRRNGSDSSPDAEPSCYTSVRRDSSPDAEPSCYTSVRRDSSPKLERSCYTSVLRAGFPDSIRRSRSKSSRIPTLIDGHLWRQQKVIHSNSHNEPVTLQKRYISPSQNNQSLYQSAQEKLAGLSIYKAYFPKEEQSKKNSESVVDNSTSSSHWQYVSTKSSAHNRSVTWQNPISTFDEVDAALADSTDESTSWSPRKDGHSPQTIPLTSTSASDEITSESISSDEFKRCLESKKLLSPEKRTSMWVKGIYKSNMQEYFDADMSSILPALNSHSSSSDTANMKCGATAANMKTYRIEPSAPPQSEIIGDGSYFHSFRCLPTAPPDISNTAVAGISGEKSDGLSNSDYISLHPSLYPSLVEPCQNSATKKLSEPQLKDNEDNNFEAPSLNATSAAYVSFDSEPEPPTANVHCSPENPRAHIGFTQKTSKMCSVNIIPSVSSQEVDTNIKPLPCDPNHAVNRLHQISKTISTQTPVLRIPPDPPNKTAPSPSKRNTQIKELNKAKRTQKSWSKLKKFFSSKKIRGQIGSKAFISVDSNQSFLQSCHLSRLGERSSPFTDTSGTQTEPDIYEPTLRHVEIVKSDEVSLSVNLSEQLSDYSEKYPSSIIPGLALNLEQAIQSDFLETCSSSGATSGSMERLLSPFCEDSFEDDHDEVDCAQLDIPPIEEGNEEVGEDDGQAVPTETKIFGETYKTQLSKTDKRRRSNNVEFLHIDPEMQIQFIERRISTESQCGEQSDDSESTEIYDWKSFSKSVNDDLDVAPEETKSVYWRTCGEKPDEAKTDLNKVKKPIGCLSDAELRQTLIDHGLPHPGPITQGTRQMYLKRLKNATGGHNLGCTQSSPDYNAELCRAMNEIVDWTEMIEFEEKMIKKFDNPKNSRKWREGNEKSSFNYLLLDPRVTKNLPSRASRMDDTLEAFRTFVKAIFYIGKGKRSRPYAHLYEAIKYSQGKNTKANEKISHITDIWNSGHGVVSLHCFQNVIPVEAYSREACMVDAIGCCNLTNKKRGDFYGLTATWGLKLKRRMGVYLLNKALKIFLAEGERQIYPTDLH